MKTKTANSVLTELIGGAENVPDQVKHIIDALNVDGVQFNKEENAATLKKASKLARVYKLQQELAGEPELQKAIMHELRGQIATAAGTTLREHAGQDLAKLIFQACYKLPKTTAWRYSRLITFLASLDFVKPAAWGEEIIKRGGLLECILEATAARDDAVMGPRQNKAKRCTPLRSFDDEERVENAENGGDDFEHLEDGGDDDDCEGAEPEGMANRAVSMTPLHVWPAVVEAFRNEPFGRYRTLTTWEVSALGAAPISIDVKQLRKKFVPKPMHGWSDTHPEL